jgi:glycosyltransferase involved in cell wall biosynthesis
MKRSVVVDSLKAKAARMKIVFVTANFFSAKAFALPLAIGCRQVSDVILVGNFSREEARKLEEMSQGEITIKSIPLVRRPHLWSDAVALTKLIGLFLREQPDIVHSITPKSGLLTQLAGFLVRVPVRLHTFTGQVWQNFKGFKRKFFILIDKVIVGLCTVPLSDGFEQAHYLKSSGVVKAAEEITVIGSGSIAGVDFDRIDAPFKIPDVIQGLGLREDVFIILFMARITEDKGIQVLMETFIELARRHSKVKLLIVGPDEEGLVENRQLRKVPHVVVHDYVDDPLPFIKCCDVFVSPSFREGFPMTLLSVLAVGKPAFVSDIHGHRELVEFGDETFLHQPGNSGQLTDQIDAFLLKSDVDRHSISGAKVYEHFERRNFINFYIGFLLNQLNSAKLVKGGRRH